MASGYSSVTVCLARMLQKPEYFVPYVSPHTLHYFIRGVFMRGSVPLISDAGVLREHSDILLPECEMSINQTGISSLNFITSCFMKADNDANALADISMHAKVAEDIERENMSGNTEPPLHRDVERIDLNGLFRAMQDRPTAFFPGPSFSLMASFINGLYFALQNWGMEVTIAPDLDRFEKKIEAEYQLEGMRWHRLIYYSHPNEEVNFEKFFRLLKKYQLLT